MKEQLISSSPSTISEDEDDLQQFTINEHYAKAFQYRKEREELTKLKEKYGSDAETDDPNSGDSDSESDESEDEDGEELTPALDAAILRTLARIKARDPVIYDNGRNVFEEEHSQSRPLPAPSRTKKVKAEKPVTIQEQRLAAALEVASTRSTSPEAPSPPPTHVAEQAALRAETIAAFHSNDAVQGADDTGDAEMEEEEEEEGGLFTLREKTRDEVEREEAEYRAYLEREVGPLEQILDIGEEEKAGDEVRRPEEDVHVPPGAADSGKKKRKKKGGKVAEEKKQTDQEFLVNYILHRGWIDRSARRIPTYKEATSVKDPDPPATSSEANVGAGADGEQLLEDDEVFDEVAERFESSYNFRFEEPDAAHIPSFPRAVESVRRPTEHTERRQAARERRRERKEAEKAERREEVKRLKGLKAREVEAKLERIGKEGGWARNKALEALDLDADWDSDAHDQQMAAVLAEIDGVGTGGNDDKPTWDDEIDIDDIIPPIARPVQDESSHASAVKERRKAKKKERKKRLREDEASAVDVNEMDADAPSHGGPELDEVEWDGTDEMRKRVLDQYMDEVFGLEFNDMVAGMPTRFRYVPVAQASFGLSASEILLAEDKDLNEYVGLKKLAPFRKQRSTWDAKRGERLREFKNKISGRLGEADATGIAQEHDHLVDGEHKAKKRKGKKERMREKAARAPEDAEVVEMEAIDPPRQSNNRTEEREEESSQPVKKKRRRQKKAENPFKQTAE